MNMVGPDSPVRDSPVQQWDNDDVEEPAGHGDLNQHRVELEVLRATTAALPGDEPEYGGGNLRDLR